MPYKETCNRCLGKGGYDALTSYHDDTKEYVKCGKCNGKGYIFVMTDEDESDYRSSMDDW